MIIRANKDQKLRLIKTELRLLQFCHDSRLTLDQLKTRPTRVMIDIIPGERCGLDGGKYPISVSYKEGRIGCCTFSPATFAKILKAAGVKKARKKKATK